MFDKKLGRELLKKPIRLAVLNNTHSFDWPAWEVKHEDLSAEPYMYPCKTSVKIRDEGAALCSLEIIATAGKSRFTQIISLGSESEYLSVYNETDWREEASLLKAEFPLAAENETANYDIGIGYTKRGTNTKSLYEVPAQKWADITDESGEFGVSVFSDSRQGWDKPDKSTLRLTVAHTPLSNFRWECSQHVMDMGINRYSYGITGHGANPDAVTADADAFCCPMHTFITEKHSGDLGREYSLVSLNDGRVRITAIKKAQESDGIVFRVAECSGNDVAGVEAVFANPVAEAYEIRGDEVILGETDVIDGKLIFDMGHNGIRSFLIRFRENKEVTERGKVVPLNFNAIGITADGDFGKSELKGGISVPAELVPQKLVCAGVDYEIHTDAKNCLVCNGGEIIADKDCRSLHLLLTSLGGDKTVNFECGGKTTQITVPDCFEALGHWDLMMLGKTGYIKAVPQALTFSHTHGKKGNIAAKQFYVFHAEIPLDGDCKVKLPVDDDIVIFAATAVDNSVRFEKGDVHFDSLEKRPFDYEFSDYAVKLMNPNGAERVLDKFFDRTVSLNVKMGEFYNKYALDELYYILRNLSNKTKYKKNVLRVTDSRKNKGES